jgi:hypothetical protein
MDKYSLNKKWFVPREENIEQEGFSTFLVLKKVLIHIKDHFQQLPGGKIDLNTITMKINQPYAIIVKDLEDLAIFFEERIDEDSGANIMFFDVKDFKDVPNGASAVTTEWLGLHAGFLVETFNGEVEHKDDCLELCGYSHYPGDWSEKSRTKWSEYHDGYILYDESCYVESCGEYFQEDNQPDGVHWSDWNDNFVDSNDDDVGYGITNSNGSTGWFYSDERVYCEDNDTDYVNGEMANNNGVYYRGGYWTTYIGNNAEYQSQERVFKFNRNTVFGIGFEIEKEDCDAVEIEWSDLHSKTSWAKESDSSLCDDTGYELVSPAFDLFDDKLDKDIEQNKDLQVLINAEFSTSCGGHLTFSSSEYTANELIEGVAGFIPLMYAMYNGRLCNTYCEPKQKWVYHRGSGRDAVNIRGNRSIREADGKVFGAVEFRLFSAVRSVKNLLWRRDFMKIVANNVNKSEKEVLRMLCNPNSLLFKHLIKVYDTDKIVNKIELFVKFSKEYNFRKLQMPDLQSLRDKLKQSNNNNDSTNELGA